MITILVYLIIVAICIGLAVFIIDQVGVPEPLRRWFMIAVIVVGALALILILLRATGVDVPLSVRP